ncbi:MAG: SDR family NAD(P)-dependent oxidoreductase, partial [Anaerolineales bacterium]|nr:SDR family NAD(P)-dependent oxidoreductase [Anaerolineales bacterium]
MADYSSEMQEKVVIVTGAGKGIGRAIAERFAAEGAAVVVNDVEQDRADQAASAITANGGRALGVAADVADKAQVDRLFDAAIEHFGRVDVLVNNAAL